MARTLARAPRWRRLIGRWCARYLPAEVVGTISAVASAYFAYLATGDRATAAIAGTIGENVGFYGVMAVIEWRRQGEMGPMGRQAKALRTIRVLSAEFGPAELIDSLLVRPGAMYVGPFVTGGITSGSLLGKIMADAVFYAVAIASFEIVQRRGGGGRGLAGAGAPAKKAMNGGRLAFAGSGDGPRRGGRGVPPHDRGVARGRTALRHEVQRVPARAKAVEGAGVRVRDRVGQRAGRPVGNRGRRR
ncbi:hypothetical protein [Virgisporangium aurantiacum]|uniref:Uncharacterized protein n=1 Tax=Virgisporangium aurantiacum TaxID=175570 RepID=A0A8J3ZD27_9ACTN|nr:hypothetical protein [Virgisporangium aurantiacum]GIJ59406.1 hypothetical protein Vau01_069220 [Virgisporangium aurantiacum]